MSAVQTELNIHYCILKHKSFGVLLSIVIVISVIFIETTMQGFIYCKKSETMPKPKFKVEKLCHGQDKIYRQLRGTILESVFELH
jgi:hypothetical protein